ncbi:hypothetical protein HMPREF9969_0086 [Prevotella sp. oral taxon 306 str. F0472]|nr:hypothetical protein HMPREF9969_0086 [Prevotella sp. oral taxon 306 str. F0472]
MPWYSFISKALKLYIYSLQYNLFHALFVLYMNFLKEKKDHVL